MSKKIDWSKYTNVFFMSLKIVSKALSVIAKISKIALIGISFAAYTYLYSWQFALIIMLQLLIHEYGHIWAMKKVGIPTKGIYFIPFVGGAAVASEDFKSRRDEVYVAIMGPIFGFACALSMYIVYLINDEAMYAAAAAWMAMVNLFNLLPINPLDGGRIMKSIAFSLHSKIGFAFMSIGILCSIALAFLAHIWIFILVIILSSLEIYMEFWYGSKQEARKLKFKEDLDNITLNYINDCTKNNTIPDIGYLEHRKEENKKIVEESYPIIPVKPIMSKNEMVITVISYFILAFGLYAFMQITYHIPGAAIAMELLQD
jgi:Zn-dependent protease